MWGVIDLNKSQEVGHDQFICFIAHPPKCGGTALITELSKNKELRVVIIANEREHYTPYQVSNLIPKFWKKWKHLPIYCINSTSL